MLKTFTIGEEESKIINLNISMYPEELFTYAFCSGLKNIILCFPISKGKLKSKGSHVELPLESA